MRKQKHDAYDVKEPKEMAEEGGNIDAADH